MPEIKNNGTYDITRGELLALIGKLPDELLDQFAKISALYLGYIALGESNVGKNNISSNVRVENNMRINYINEVFNAINMINKLVSISSNGIDPRRQANDNSASGSLLKAIEFYNTFAEDSIGLQTAGTKEEVEEFNTLEKVANKVTNKEEKKKAYTTKASSSSKSSKKKVDSNKENTVKESNTKKKAAPKNKKEATGKAVKEAVKKSRSDFLKSKEADALTVEDIIKQELDAYGISKDVSAYGMALSIPKACKAGMTYSEAVNAIGNLLGKKANVVSSCISYIAKNANFSKTIHLPKLAKIGIVTKEDLMKEFLDFCVE